MAARQDDGTYTLYELTHTGDADTAEVTPVETGLDYDQAVEAAGSADFVHDAWPESRLLG